MQYFTAFYEAQLSLSVQQQSYIASCPNKTLSLLIISDGAVTSSNLYDNIGPTFELQPPIRLDFTNNVGGRLDCTGKGIPTPNVEWFDGDNNLVSTIPNVSLSNYYWLLGIIWDYRFGDYKGLGLLTEVDTGGKRVNPLMKSLRCLRREQIKTF